ncbi:MAG: gluconate 2-dehydrogenase subunit 3 family protein [Bacteroidetes bacterium]|nr:gluconate 2-dehydrogenase subunit 3 family protein [Bacteroidota bacterium]
MDRREAIQKVSWILGGTIIGSSIFLEYGCHSNTQQTADFFDKSTTDLLNEIAETILPKTNTPGAKDAKVGEFMNVMVKDCYTKADQDVFKAGIQSLEKGCKLKTGKNFMDCSLEERTSYLSFVDAEQKAYTVAKAVEDPAHYFRMMKELTLLGFFTSEVGATKALRYIETPGSYNGNLPYKKGDRAWA